MFATVRRIRAVPGRIAEVAALIEAEYVPIMRGVSGFVSYTLVDVGDDEVASIGTFTDEAAADEANTAAHTWSKERLGALVASPLEARAGRVLVQTVETTAS